MIGAAARRWLILTQYYAPEIGAPQIRLRALARELRRHGHEVAVLTAMPNYPVGKVFRAYEGRWRCEEELDGVTIRRTWVYAATGKSACNRLANYLSFTVTALWTALTGSRPDIMFVESQPLTLGVIAVLMKWLRGVPYVYNVPDLQVDVARQMNFISSRWLLQLAYSLENFFLKNSWKVSTVTRAFMAHFEGRRLPREQITFLPNGADTEFLRPKAPCRQLLQRWNLEGKKVFVYVGTHAYYHGLDTLIDAAELLRDRDDIAVLMIGDGPERRRLIKVAEARGLRNVVFGQSPYDEMDSLYSIAYGSLVTLRNIEVAKQMRLSKVFPSLSCGVPVIYGGIGEAADMLSTNCCGVVVPPENPQALAAAMEALVASGDDRDRMGKAGRNLVEREYSWPAIVQAWLTELTGANGTVSVELACTHPDRGWRKGHENSIFPT